MLTLKQTKKGHSDWELLFTEHFFFHVRATRVCTFTSEHTKIFSASDDKTVRQWDVPTEKELKNFNGATVIFS